MKKITLIIAVLAVTISYGQVASVKSVDQLTSSCAAGGKLPVSYPNGHTDTGGYAGPSGTDNWEINETLDDNDKKFINGEVNFVNNIPVDTPNSSIISISDPNFTLTSYAHRGTENTLTGCSFGANSNKKIRFNLEYTGTYTIDPLTPVSVSMTVTDVGGATAPQIIAVTITPMSSASIKDLEKFNFSFGPNPTSDVIRLSSAENITSVKVVNILGQEMLSTEPNVRATAIDIASLNEGVYIIKVAIRDEVGTFRIVKE